MIFVSYIGMTAKSSSELNPESQYLARSSHLWFPRPLCSCCPPLPYYYSGFPGFCFLALIFGFHFTVVFSNLLLVYQETSVVWHSRSIQKPVFYIFSIGCILLLPGSQILYFIDVIGTVATVFVVNCARNSCRKLLVCSYI